MDRRATLTQLEGRDWGPPTFDSSLVRRCHAARHVPIGELDTDQLRMLLGQDIGTAYVLPLAVERLLDALELPDDMYPGALLRAACLRYPIASPVLRYGLELVVARERLRADLEDLDELGVPPPGRPPALPRDEPLRSLLYANGAPDDGPRDAALEAAICAAPDDPGPCEVYGDWLLERGEPRGELIQTVLRGRDASALVERHRRRWLGPATLTDAVVAVWRHGFVREVAFAGAPDAFLAWLAADLVDRPVCAAVRELRFQLQRAAEPPGATGAPLPAVERLRFELVEDGWIGDWIAWWVARCPALATLELGAGVVAEEPAHVRVVRLAAV